MQFIMMEKGICMDEKYQKKAIEMELERHWEEAREVIQMFNEYGGGPESDEGDACDHLWKMDEIVKSHDISWEKRVVILDEMLEEFFAGNSGFDDILIQVAESFCLKNEEKRYLADALSGGCSGYYRGYAAQIYRQSLPICSMALIMWRLPGITRRKATGKRNWNISGRDWKRAPEGWMS